MRILNRECSHSEVLLAGCAGYELAKNAMNQQDERAVENEAEAHRALT